MKHQELTERIIGAAIAVQVVERTVIVELKSIACLEPIHIAQVLTYLKLSGHGIGLLINFNVELLKDGLHRLVLD
ncbi:MAG: GxxExxY protein [Longimicrobiales bacterium]